MEELRNNLLIMSKMVGWRGFHMKGKFSHLRDTECGCLSQHFRYPNLCSSKRHFNCVSCVSVSWVLFLLFHLKVMVCVLLSFKLFRCRWHFLLLVCLTPLRRGVFTEDGFHNIKLWIWKFMLFLWVWISSLISPLLDMYFCLHPFFCYPAISS